MDLKSNIAFEAWIIVRSRLLVLKKINCQKSDQLGVNFLSFLLAAKNETLTSNACQS